MLNWWQARRQRRETASKLYGSIVAAARAPAFYDSHGVPDTAEGRFEMIAVHIFLALERLKPLGEPGQEIGRALLEAFVADMDASLREMGVGDLTVPRQVKKAAGALHDRVEDYRRCARAAGDAGLAGLLQANLVPHGGALDESRFAAYLRASRERLAALPEAELRTGTLVFADPATQ